MSSNAGSPTYAGVAGADQQSAPRSGVEENAGIHVARVEVPAALRPTEHLPGTWKLRLSGPGAVSARPEMIGACLLSKGKISSIDIWKKCKYYRLSNPFERYVSFRGCGETPALSHQECLEAVFDANSLTKGKIECFDLEERETHFMLQFAPPGATQTYIKSILHQAGVKPTKMERSAVRQDQWFCTAVCLESEVPHYIASTNLTSKPLPEDRTAILVTVPGRPIKCFHCGQSGHWSNKCVTGRDTRQQRYLLREQTKSAALEKARHAQQQLEAAQTELEEQIKEQRRVDALLLKQQSDALAGAVGDETVVPASGSQDSVAADAAPVDSTPQGGEQTAPEATSNKKASPPKQSGSPPGNRGPPRGSLSLHASPANPRKTRRKSHNEATPRKKPCTPRKNIASEESLSLDDADFLEGVGLGSGDEMANALVLKQFLFRREGEKTEEVETELQLEDLEIDLDADLELKAPGNPASQVSPELTASGNVTSFQRPPDLPPQKYSTPSRDELLSASPGSRESTSASPASNRSTPFVIRSVRSIEGKSDAGKNAKKKEKHKVRTNSIDRKKATPSPRGEQSVSKMV